MRIDLLGTSFTIQSDQDPSYLRDVVEFYKTHLEQIQSSVTTNDQLKIAILAGILIVDEFFKYKNGNSPSTTLEALEADRITKDLLKKLDGAIQNQLKNDN